MSEAIPNAGNQAQKRTLTEIEKEDASINSHFFSKTPSFNSNTANQAQSMTSVDHPDNERQEKGGNLPAFDAEEEPSSARKRNRLQSMHPASSDEESTTYSEGWNIPLGADWIWTEPEEEGIFSKIGDLVATRFHLPPKSRVDWVGRNYNDNLFLAQTSQGFCYFNSSLSRCWRLAFTSSELQEKCKEGLLPISACEELVLARSSGEPDSETTLRPRDSGNIYIEIPSAEWSQVNYITLVDSVLRLRNTSLSPPSDSKISDGHSDRNHSLSSGTMGDRSSSDHSTLPGLLGFDPMVVEPDKPETMELDE